MDKMAIFVEGQTERMFIEMCICEIAERKGLYIESRKISGGTSVPRTVNLLNTIGDQRVATKYFLIYDCGNDEKEKSRIIEEYATLKMAGYSRILGVRDLFPIMRRDYAKLERGLYLGLPGADIEFVIAVMEVEVWFLSCFSFFAEIDSSLDESRISRILGFNPATYDLESVRQPSKSIHRVLRSVRMEYRKRKAEVQSIVSKLDYADLYVRVRSMYSHLDKLFNQIDAFL